MTIDVIYHIVTNFPEICAFKLALALLCGLKSPQKKVRKQVRGCLQTLYQSVAIHLKYVLLVMDKTLSQTI